MQHNTSLLLFGKVNYPLLVVGVLVIFPGFTFAALNQEVRCFGVPGLSFWSHPMVSGFVIEFFAITYKSKQAR